MSKITCDQCNMVSIQGLSCHETGCPNGGPSITCGGCNETVLKRNVYTANDWDGIEYCKECASRAAEYEAELEAAEADKHLEDLKAEYEGEGNE